MAEGSPKHIARNHVIDAARLIEAGEVTGFGEPTGYWALFEDERYAPRELAGTAALLATGERFGPRDFSGGEGPRQAIGAASRGRASARRSGEFVLVSVGGWRPRGRGEAIDTVLPL